MRCLVISPKIRDMKLRYALYLFLYFFSNLTGSLHAQSLSIEITGVGQTQMPIALAPFSAKNNKEYDFRKTLDDVIQANLRRTGAFNCYRYHLKTPTCVMILNFLQIFLRDMETRAAVIDTITDFSVLVRPSHADSCTTCPCTRDPELHFSNANIFVVTFHQVHVAGPERC